MVAKQILSSTLFASVLAGSCTAAGSDQTVQVNLDKLLNARVIITREEGQLQLAVHALDHGGSILITKAAADVSKAVDSIRSHLPASLPQMQGIRQ